MGRRGAFLALVVAFALLSASCAAGGGPDVGEALVSPEVPAAPSPSPQPSFVFAVKGDWGAGTPEQAAVTRSMCNVRESEPFDVVVTTGDNFYLPDGVATRQNYFLPEECLISWPGHQWRAVWGNHDLAGDSTATVLGSPERTYTWSIGSTQFFMLDSNRTADGPQQDWLAAELAASRAQVKIVVFHHPPFTVGLHENNLEAERRWVPLFEQHGVSLVLSGHNHGYEHAVVNGIEYVVSGGGGARVYPCVNDQPWLRVCLPVHHFLMVEVEGSAISVRAVGVSGEEIDSFVTGG